MADALARLLREFYLERTALLLRHEAVAARVTAYDANNAYQNAIAREEAHLSWLVSALAGLGEAVPPDPPAPALPADGPWAALAAEDAGEQAAFVERWRPRVDGLTDARHRRLLSLVLGEMLEHRRLFAQAAEGRTDLLGTSLPANEHHGTVLGTRWVE